MNLSFLRRAGILSIIGATLIGLASCININEELGQNLIPTHHQWDVFPSVEAPMTDIVLKASDSLSAYSTIRITFGEIND